MIIGLHAILFTDDPVATRSFLRGTLGLDSVDAGDGWLIFAGPPAEGEVHRWHLGDERANDADATAEGWLMRPRGAYVMGRNMFGPIRGEWDEDWDGWWGSEPPYHAPVFVLTHHAREPIELEGGTSFHFVTRASRRLRAGA